MLRHLIAIVTTKERPGAAVLRAGGTIRIRMLMQIEFSAPECVEPATRDIRVQGFGSLAGQEADIRVTRRINDGAASQSKTTGLVLYDEVRYSFCLATN